MQIDINYDTSAQQSSQFANIQLAVNAAVAFYEHVFSNPITITINVGWGEVAGGHQNILTVANSGTLARSQFQSSQIYTYSQIYGALQGDTNTADNLTAFNSLPNPGANPNFPSSGATFKLTNAEALALGLTGNAVPSNDLYIGLNSAVNWTFDPYNRAVPGAFDAIAEIEHEISEVMGRYGSLGQNFGANVYEVSDLFRYYSAGSRDLTYGPAGASEFLSIDGNNMLLQFNNPSNNTQDPGDLLPSIRGNSYGDGFAGVIGAVTGPDLRWMNVIGWNRPVVTTADYNGDGTSDVLWMNTDNTDVGYWAMQGSNDGFVDLGAVGANWNVVDHARFFGQPNGADIVWSNSASGDIGYWLMSNGVSQGYHELGAVSTNWQIQSTQGHSSFFGNGIDDLLWRDTLGGDVGFWNMQNGSNAGFVNLGVVSTNWQIQGTGDLFGTGTDGIVWRDQNSGDVGYWAMQNGAMSGGFTDFGIVSTDWKIVGVGALLAGGNADILWENSNGDVGYWTMTGGNNHTYTPLGSVGANSPWQVVGLGNVTGGLSFDIEWRNSANGDTGVWHVDNAGAHFHDVGMATTNWKVV